MIFDIKSYGLIDTGTAASLLSSNMLSKLKDPFLDRSYTH
jgi:hypothetical protein